MAVTLKRGTKEWLVDCGAAAVYSSSIDLLYAIPLYLHLSISRTNTIIFGAPHNALSTILSFHSSQEEVPPAVPSTAPLQEPQKEKCTRHKAKTRHTRSKSSYHSGPFTSSASSRSLDYSDTSYSRSWARRDRAKTFLGES